MTTHLHLRLDTPLKPTATEASSDRVSVAIDFKFKLRPVKDPAVDRRFPRAPSFSCSPPAVEMLPRDARALSVDCSVLSMLASTMWWALDRALADARELGRGTRTPSWR